MAEEERLLLFAQPVARCPGANGAAACHRKFRRMPVSHGLNSCICMLMSDILVHSYGCLLPGKLLPWSMQYIGHDGGVRDGGARATLTHQQ